MPLVVNQIPCWVMEVDEKRQVEDLFYTQDAPTIGFLLNIHGATISRNFLICMVGPEGLEPWSG